MICGAVELADFYGVEKRTITNWVNSTPPCPSWKDGTARKFDTRKVDEWRIARAVAEAMSNVSRTPPDSIAEAELRKAIADAVLAEIKAAREEGDVIPKDVLEQVVGELGDRAMAVVQNIPDRYCLDLERLGVPQKEAMTVLEQLQDEIARALRGAADEAEDDVDLA
jgi:phage terminase Nu1 subunit (DNA packaging protein)